jgi:hypothetical protein
MAKRSCHGEKKDGSPCGAPPLKPGTVIEGTTVTGKWCILHDEDLPDSARIGGAQPGSGRPRVPTATEVMRKLVEENVCAVLSPHFKILGFDVVIDEEKGIGLVAREGGGAKLYGESREGVINASDYEDLGAQLAAAEKILDRVFGKAKQSTELTGANGKPIEVDAIGVPTTQEFHEGVASILAAAGAAGDGD